MLTGGPATYAETVYADTVYANTLYATGAAQIVGASLNAGDVSTNSLETVTATVNGALTVPGASISSSGVYLTGPASYVSSISGPTATLSSISCSTVTGGTASFQSLVVPQAAFSGTLSVGTVTGTGLWSGVATLSRNLALPQYAMASSYLTSQTVVHLGTWTAPVGGHVLKLNYLSCCGFNVNQAVSSTYPGTITSYGPQIVDLDIYFYTSDGVSHATLANGSPFYGYGYGVSTQVTATPQGIWVTMNQNMVFDFYVYTGPMIGNPVLTAMTSQTWVTDLTSASGVLPANAQRLRIAANCTSMVKSYTTLG